jgi:tetratricopeptide (TPR) repeat protein
VTYDGEASEEEGRATEPQESLPARRQWNGLAPTGDFAALVARVVAIIEDARSRVVRTVNSEMVLSYWHIGREIVEYVQRGESRAEYGEQVIEDLSAQLLARVGRGYSTRNLWYFRDFYLTYRERAPSIRAEVFRTSLVQNSKPINAAKILHEAGTEFARGFSSRLSWTHYRALLKVSDPAVRAFYEIEAERENWSTPHLERQIFTALHLRLLKSRNKAGVMELARGKIDAAEQAFKRALDADGRSITAHLSLANLYWLSGRPAEAELALKRSLEIEPNNVIANRTMAALLIVTNRAELAEPHLRKVAEITKSASAAFILADYYIARNADSSAIAVLEQFRADPKTGAATPSSPAFGVAVPGAGPRTAR